MRRLVAVLYLVMLTADGFSNYAEYMFSPTLWARVFLDPLSIKIRPWDLVMAVILIFAAGRPEAKGARFRPMTVMELLAAATTIVFFAYGLARGGDFRAASWQVYLVLAAILASFTVAATCRTSAHCALLLKMYIAAAFYRAIMCIIFYLLYVRPMIVMPPPSTLSTHDDTVLWTFVIIVLLANAIEIRGKRSALYAAIGVPVLLVAIQLNNRRLAWVSLTAALIVFYALLRPSKMKRRMTRWLFVAIPIVLLYIAVGWGRTERMFKPLQAFETVTTVEDASTKARNVENLGLIATAYANGWVTGTGFGHKYIALSNKYSIAEAFELWPYIPHNSVLGIFAFTGFVGFLGLWLRVPTAVFALSRMARMAERPADRAAGIIGVAGIVICCNQCYGDMGIFTAVNMYTFALVYGAAMRLPVASGTWMPRSRPRAQRRPRLDGGAGWPSSSSSR